MGAIPVFCEISIGGEEAALHAQRFIDGAQSFHERNKHWVRKRCTPLRPVSVPLAAVDGRTLGFSGMLPHAEIFSRAEALGFGILPAEAVIAVESTLQNQLLVGERYGIGTPPIMTRPPVNEPGCTLLEHWSWFYLQRGNYFYRQYNGNEAVAVAMDDENFRPPASLPWLFAHPSFTQGFEPLEPAVAA